MGNITFLGVEGSGKTVLTMALARHLSKQADAGWHLCAATRDAYRFIQSIPDKFTHDNLPSQTSFFKYLALTLKQGEEDVRQIDLLDYPGEIYRLSFLDPDEDTDSEFLKHRIAANEEDIKEFLNQISLSDRVFVLFNPEDAVNQGTDNRKIDAVWATNASLDYLKRIPTKPKVTLVLTQVDRFCDLANEKFDARRYLKQNLPLIYANFPGIDVIATAVLDDSPVQIGLPELTFRCIEERVGAHISTAAKSTDVLFNALRGEKFDRRTLHSAITDVQQFVDQVASNSWCCSATDFCTAMHISDPRELFDLVNLATCLDRAGIDDSKSPAQKKSVMYDVQNRMIDVAVVTEGGRSLKSSALDVLSQTLDDLTAQIDEEEQRKVYRRQMNEQLLRWSTILLGFLCAGMVIVFLWKLLEFV